MSKHFRTFFGDIRVLSSTFLKFLDRIIVDTAQQCFVDTYMHFFKSYYPYTLYKQPEFITENSLGSDVVSSCDLLKLIPSLKSTPYSKILQQMKKRGNRR